MSMLGSSSPQHLALTKTLFTSIEKRFPIFFGHIKSFFNGIVIIYDITFLRILFITFDSGILKYYIKWKKISNLIPISYFKCLDLVTLS